MSNEIHLIVSDVGYNFLVVHEKLTKEIQELGITCIDSIKEKWDVLKSTNLEATTTKIYELADLIGNITSNKVSNEDKVKRLIKALPECSNLQRMARLTQSSNNLERIAETCEVQWLVREGRKSFH